MTMKHYARLVDGIVAEVKDLPADFVLDALFGPDHGWVEAANTIAQGWAFDGRSFAPPAGPPPPSQAELMAYAADKRWRSETGGIVLGGVPIATDDRAKMMILGARMAAQADPDWTTVWHGADGSSYPLNAASIVAISDAVQAHVSAVFAAFAIVKVDIEAGEIATTAEIDAAFG